MRLSHNKKRNTAFVYEALVRELTKSVVKNNKNRQNKVVSIMKEHFSGETHLKEELQLYKSIYETTKIEKDTAEKIVLEAKKRYSELDKRKIFKEQSALINKINKILSNKVFNNFVPNYRNIASVYSIFNDKLPPKDRVLLEHNVIDQMSLEEGPSDSGTSHEERKSLEPVDNIVYSTFVQKFNKEYSDVLNESQKNLMTRYISSFADNGLELKIYLNEEIGRLKQSLLKAKSSVLTEEDPTIRPKIEAIHDVLESMNQKEVDVSMLETILKTQQLVQEIEENDNNG